MLKAIKLHVRIENFSEFSIMLLLCGLRSMADLVSLSILLESRNENGLNFDWSAILKVTTISLTYLSLSSLDINKSTLQVVT